MAFIPIPNTDLEVGKPTKKSIFQKTKDNFDDHESRIGDLSAGAAKVEVFSMELVGLENIANATNDVNRIALFKAPVDFSITNAQIYVLHGGPNADVAPTSGTLEIDIRKGNSLSTIATIFNVRPAVSTFGDGDTNATVSFITNGEVITQGQWLQLDITNLQTLQTRIFVNIYGEVS